MFQRSCTGSMRSRCFQRNVIASLSKPVTPLPAPDSPTAASVTSPTTVLSPRQRRLAEQQRQWRLEKEKSKAKEARMAARLPTPAPITQQPDSIAPSPSPGSSSAVLRSTGTSVSRPTSSSHPRSTSHVSESEQLVKDILLLAQQQLQQHHAPDPIALQAKAKLLLQEAQHLATTSLRLLGSMSHTQKSEAAWGLSHVSRDMAQPIWEHMGVSFEVVPSCMPHLKLQDFLDEVELKRDTIYLDSGARAVEESRLTGWQSDIGATFIYSGKEMLPQQGQVGVQAEQHHAASLHTNEKIAPPSLGMSQDTADMTGSASSSDTSASYPDLEGHALAVRDGGGDRGRDVSSGGDSGKGGSSSKSEVSRADGCGMTPAVAAVRDCLTKLTGVWYDSVLINYYHDGRCGMRFHADPLYDRWTPNTSVVSIGETRTFVFRETDDFGVRWQYPISNGDVVIMHGDCQDRFQHCIKVERDSQGAANMEPRVSLVFKQRLKHSTSGEYIM